MKIRNPQIDTSNSGFTMVNPRTNLEFSGIRAEYFFPDYLSPQYYSYVSRYSKIRRIQNKKENEIYHETFNNYKIPVRPSDRYITVNNSTENRLDIISVRYYKSPIMWWVIALANDIIDPFAEVKLGTVLRIPELTSIYENDIV